MSSHVKRWITGVAGAAILFALIVYGPPALFDAVLIVLILIGVTEYSRMVFSPADSWERTEVLAISLLIPFAFIVGDTAVVLAIVTLSVLGVFSLYLLRIKDQEFQIIPVMKVVFGFLYLPLTLSHFILIRHGDRGVLWIFFILVLAFSGDITAFYVGRTWGKKKLLPFVSPGKTEEGMIGLIAGSTICCIVYQQLFLPNLPVVHAAILGFVGSIIGQLGDLCESAIKRASGVKDSGVILPGHGGLLDRLDCLIFITPFVYYYRLFVIA